MWYQKKLPDNLKNFELEKLNAYVGNSYSDMNLVGQYENAIDILINFIIEKGDRIDLIAHPILYLMRHSIELSLKENIRYLDNYSKLGLGKIKTHSINELFNEFEKHYNKIADDLNFKDELADEYIKYTNDLRKLILKLGTDDSSFRYINSTDGTKVFNHDITINIYELKKVFDNSRILLTHTADAISPYTDYIDYIKQDKSIKTKSFGFVLLSFPKYQKEWLIEQLNNEYKIITKKQIWFDTEKDYFLHLKIANHKCFVIPMKE